MNSIILRTSDIEERESFPQKGRIPFFLYGRFLPGFLLTNQGFMNKLIEDMERRRTKRVPDEIYPERRGRRLKALL